MFDSIAVFQIRPPTSHPPLISRSRKAIRWPIRGYRYSPFSPMRINRVFGCGAKLAALLHPVNAMTIRKSLSLNVEIGTKSEIVAFLRLSPLPFLTTIRQHVCPWHFPKVLRIKTIFSYSSHTTFCEMRCFRIAAFMAVMFGEKALCRAIASTTAGMYQY